MYPVYDRRRVEGTIQTGHGEGLGSEFVVVAPSLWDMSAWPPGMLSLATVPVRVPNRL